MMCNFVYPFNCTIFFSLNPTFVSLVNLNCYSLRISCLLFLDVLSLTRNWNLMKCFRLGSIFIPAKLCLELTHTKKSLRPIEISFGYVDRASDKEDKENEMILKTNVICVSFIQIKSRFFFKKKVSICKFFLAIIDWNPKIS